MNLTARDVNVLRSAIVEQACQDYINFKMNIYRFDQYGEIKKGKTRDDLVRDLDEVVNFFYSEWYRCLCDIDCDKLIDMLDKKFEEVKAEYERKRREVG